MTVLDVVIFIIVAGLFAATIYVPEYLAKRRAWEKLKPFVEQAEKRSKSEPPA
jgi:hypothetical protein